MVPPTRVVTECQAPTGTGRLTEGVFWGRMRVRPGAGQVEGGLGKAAVVPISLAPAWAQYIPLDPLKFILPKELMQALEAH